MEYFENLGDSLGTDITSALIGLLVGLLFGFFGQQSRFCLRATCQEVCRGVFAQRSCVWLLGFAVALLISQWMLAQGTLEPDTIYLLSIDGSISGSIVGGALFGAGMMMTRGCTSRLLILAGAGNLRALVAVVLVALAAQATIHGGLAEARQAIMSAWVMDVGQRNFNNHVDVQIVYGVAVVLMLVAFVLGLRQGAKLWHLNAGVGVGAAIALGWYLTAWHASWSFDPIAVQSISLVGPAADTLSTLVNEPNIRLRFGLGLLSGVVLGSLLAAAITRQLKVEVFTQESGTVRYLVGALLMGFGGTIAGGCSVGAAVTGGSVLSSTAFIVLASMIISAGLTDRLIDKRQA